MSYWRLLPHRRGGHRLHPGVGLRHGDRVALRRVWRWAKRFYGYYPIADEVVAASGGHRRAALHRRRAALRSELHGVYNQYLRCSSDPLYRPDDEDVLALYRPLFTTSFLIDDFSPTTASSAPARCWCPAPRARPRYGLGFCPLAGARAAGGVPGIGLTSPANLGFTAELGCYDDVIAYADVTRLSPDVAAVYVDMSGDAALRATIHGHWQDRLAYSCSVGGTHWEGLGSGKDLAGPRLMLFFAPAQAEEARRRLGPHGVSGSPRRAPGASLSRGRAIRARPVAAGGASRTGPGGGRIDLIRPCSTARFPPTKAGSWRFEAPIGRPALNLSSSSADTAAEHCLKA